MVKGKNEKLIVEEDYVIVMKIRRGIIIK